MERELSQRFSNFLLEKGFPEKSILVDFKHSKINPKFRPDILVIDIENNNFLCLIQFSSSTWTKTDLINQINYYNDNFIKDLDHNLPVYLIIEMGNDFQILEFTDGAFVLISKGEFPRYETFVAKELTERKIEKEKIEHIKIREFNTKRNKMWISSIFSIVSIILGVFVTFYSIKKQQNDKGEVIITNCDCDSLESEVLELKKLVFDMKKNNLKSNKSLLNTRNYDEKVNDLETRIRIIENGISSNPEKTLSLQNINNEIVQLKIEDEHVKEITAEKIQSLKNEMENQNSWLTGLMITIFGTILSFAIPNLLTRINDERRNNNNS